MSRPNKAFGQVAKQQDFAVEIDDTDSPYTTNGETQIYVDTSTAAVTVQLATADLAVGKSIDIYDDGNNAATNNISITTEGSATFVPGGVASLTINTDGAYRKVRGGSTNWFADLNAQRSAVATGEADITNETRVEVEATSSQTIPSGTWETIQFGTEVSDDLGEWDSTNHQFVPDKSGTYDIKCVIEFEGGADGNRRRIRLRDVDGGNTIMRSALENNIFDTLQFSGDREFTAGTTYEFQAENFDSSDSLSNQSDRRFATIRSSFREV